MIVQVCMNGRRSRLDHPGVPVTPAELARDARACVLQGCRSLHVHPRNLAGDQTLDAAAVAETLAALREAAPGIEISFTTGLWIDGDADRRLAHVAAWTARPDLASVNVSEPGAEELCALLFERGIGVEAGVATTDDVRRLTDLGVAPRCARVLVEVEGETAEAVAMVAAIDALLDGAGDEIPRLYHGYEAATWPVIDRAFGLGRDARVGLEDTLVLPDGASPAGNAELVAVCMARRPGPRR